MSFKFTWPQFSKEFIEKAKIELTEALNKGDKPANIADFILVKDLYMGSKAPELEILEISELTDDRFRGIFKLVYNGDAYISLKTKVQANPLTPLKHSRTINNKVGMLASDMPLVVPMQLRISNFKLRGVIVLVVDKGKGITLVFKNDPLEKIDVNSTFDNVPNIRRLLQRQIEAQLRKLFEEDLPRMIHSLSLLFISQQSEIFITESSKLQTDLQISSLSPNPTETTEISDESLLKRPHHQKWHGNNPEFDAFFSNQNPDDGYILYKSLYGNHSSASPTKSQVGLYSSVTDDIESLLRPVSRVNSPIYFGKNHYDAMTIHSYSKSEVGTLNRSSQIEFKSNIETPFRSPQPIQKRSDRKALMIDIASIVSDESPQLHSPQHVRLESNEVTVHLSNLFNVSYTLSTSAFDVGRILFRSQLKNESLSLKPKVQKKKRIIKLNFKISGSVVSETNSSGILS